MHILSPIQLSDLTIFWHTKMQTTPAESAKFTNSMGDVVVFWRCDVWRSSASVTNQRFRCGGIFNLILNLLLSAECASENIESRSVFDDITCENVTT